MDYYWAKNRFGYETKVNEDQKKAMEADKRMNYTFSLIPKPPPPQKPKINNPKKKNNGNTQDTGSK